MSILKKLKQKLFDFLMPEDEPNEGDFVDYTKEFIDERIIRQEHQSREQAVPLR